MNFARVSNFSLNWNQQCESVTRFKVCLRPKRIAEVFFRKHRLFRKKGCRVEERIWGCFCYVRDNWTVTLKLPNLLPTLSAKFSCHLKSIMLIFERGHHLIFMFNSLQAHAYKKRFTSTSYAVFKSARESTSSLNCHVYNLMLVQPRK